MLYIYKTEAPRQKTQPNTWKRPGPHLPQLFALRVSSNRPQVAPRRPSVSPLSYRIPAGSARARRPLLTATGQERRAIRQLTSKVRLAMAEASAV